MIYKIKSKIIYDVYEPKPSEYYNYRCINCNRVMTDKHHIFQGKAHRPKSEKYGLTVPLCNVCHDKLHYRENGIELKRKLQKIGQKIFEKYVGTKEDFMAEFHKNYLWDEE